MRSRRRRLLLVLAAAIALNAGAAGREPAQSPQSPVFRSGTQVVPIDVRVLDRAGNPVTNLTADDFTILEDKVPQAIHYFFAQKLSADPGAADTPLLGGERAGELAPQTRRVFLLIFGRSVFGEGGFQATTKSLDAALRFVRQRLLPQDQLAVIAYNRATDFTTDHARIATVIERFVKRQEQLDALITHHFSGLGAMFAGPKLPAFLQKDIDAIFEGSTSIGVREVPEEKIRSPRRVVEDLQTALAGQARTALVGPAAAGLSDATSQRISALVGLSELQFAEADIQRQQDLGRIYTGIDYLRHVDGEKHLILFTPQGMYLPALEDDESVAAVASDARVVLDTIQTGGLPSPNYGSVVTDARQYINTGFDRNKIQSLKNLAELTGGQSSIFEYGEKGLDRIARATESSYLLGYRPTNSAWEGKYRHIVVKVKRPGLTVLHRGGYFAEPLGAPTLRRSLTYARIVEAANYGSEIHNLKVQVTAQVNKTNRRTLDVSVSIDFSGVQFDESGGLRNTTLDIAIFCGDADRDPVGDLRQHIDLKLNALDHQRFLKEGSVYSVRVPVKADARFVKAIVYNYEADRVGSAIATIR